VMLSIVIEFCFDSMNPPPETPDAFELAENMALNLSLSYDIIILCP
jgi:hypothetical protein